MMADPRAGLGGYINDANHGGFQLGRAKTLAQDPAIKIEWVAILIAEARVKQRIEVLENRQVVDEWKAALNPLGCKVGVEVVHSTDPEADAQHYQGWKHVDLFMCNAEQVYVDDPSRSARFLAALGPTHPPLTLSTNGDPAQKPFDYRVWEKRKAWLATQAYWQFNVVSYLTPRFAHQNAYLPAQVNVGPSSTSWWYRVWLRGKGNRWTQSAGLIPEPTDYSRQHLVLEDGQTNSRWFARTRLKPDGGTYLQDRVLLAPPKTGTLMRDVGRVLGFFPKDRITPHVSNEDGDQGRPTPADLTAKIAACPTRKLGTGVFTLDNATNDELRAIRAGMSA